MELREYLTILARDRFFLMAILLLGLLLGLLVFFLQPTRFEGTLLLNIGRQAGNAPSSGEYTYDDFYRLQADERFADTVVRWLGHPRVTEDIRALYAERAGHPAGTSGFEARRLSSQVIEVRFTVPAPSTAAPLSEALVSVVNRYTADLNEGEAPAGWFTVKGSAPVVGSARLPLWEILAAGFAFGLLAGFFGVLFRHYLRTASSHAHRH
jgi:hypothetical protein